jgi:hypothetical protein
MKRLKTGVVNTLSFVKMNSFTVNSFAIKLDKLVGDYSLTLSSLIDNNSLDSCKDFISLNVDLLSNDIDGGEYSLTLIYNGTDEYVYLVDVKDYTTTQSGAGIYGDSVKFTDL